MLKSTNFAQKKGSMLSLFSKSPNLKTTGLGGSNPIPQVKLQLCSETPSVLNRERKFGIHRDCFPCPNLNFKSQNKN